MRGQLGARRPARVPPPGIAISRPAQAARALYHVRAARLDIILAGKQLQDGRWPIIRPDAGLVSQIEEESTSYMDLPLKAHQLER